MHYLIRGRYETDFWRNGKDAPSLDSHQEALEHLKQSNNAKKLVKLSWRGPATDQSGTCRLRAKGLELIERNGEPVIYVHEGEPSKDDSVENHGL